MWNSKMAARWRRKDGDLNAGNSDFPTANTPHELILSQRGVGGVEMDSQSCMDHSILAIFEDSTAASEDKNGAEEESETLLSALTEMLDSVEDDDGTPFDILPDTKLLTHPERRNTSVDLSPADRLRPRSKSPNITFTIKIDEEKEDKSKTENNSPPQLFKQHQTLFQPKKKKAEAEVEVFTSTSLINLVKIMHSYSLKLHVEEDGDKLNRNHTLFSQEEVWKYERPTEESDEEINVVSDDEVTVNETKEDGKRDEDRDNDKLLKSVLLNGSTSRPQPSREKKRVSFGPVQVLPFDEPVEKGMDEKNLTSGHKGEALSASLNSTKALENPDDSALEPKTVSSEVISNKPEVLPPKGEVKAKSLSLQQYRQLRQKRQPLVEKQGNYTTKWPSVSEPPKELTPILCLQGQRQNSCGPKSVQHYPDGRRGGGADHLHRSQTPGHKTHRTSAPPRPHPKEAKPLTPLCRSGLKRPRTESKISSPASPLPAVAANPNIIVHESKNSPVKKPSLLSSDPPNPVLLPISVSRTTSPSTDQPSSESTVEPLNRDYDLDSTRHFQQIQNDSSGTSLQQQPSSLGPKPQDCTTLFQEIKNKLSEIASTASARSSALCPATTRTKPLLEPQKCSPHLLQETDLEPKTPSSSRVDVPVPVKETLAEFPQSKTVSEEASSTLQFAIADSGIEAPDLTSLLEQFEETQAKVEQVEPPSDVSGTPETHRSLPHLQMSEGEDIPEALGTEIILSTRQDLPSKRRNAPLKAIQIIDPRPLPSKKIHGNLPEVPAAFISPHVYSAISSDHDYCGPLDHSLANISQCNRASKVKDISKNTGEVQVNAHESSAAAESKHQTSTKDAITTNMTVTNSVKSVTQHLPEEPRIRSETTPSKFSESTDAQKDCGCAAEDKAATCTLPTPPPSPPVRGRDKRRYRRRSPRSDSSSSSCSSSSSSSSSSTSRSPKRQKRYHRSSESSSCSSSPSRSVSRSPPRRNRWSYSRSRSRSWSQSRSPSRSRSPSPQICSRRWRDVNRSRESRKLRREQEIRIQKLKAIDERRVVYVGRICRSMTHSELRERFSQFGDVECVSLHFRERGDHYGFVTFYDMNDAFAAIDNGSKLRRPDELPFDLCFGGRRQFCNSDYADLDANRDADSSPAKSRFEDLDFDQLLKQAQRGLKR